MGIDLEQPYEVDTDGNIVNPASRENQVLEIAQLTAINGKLVQQVLDFGASSAGLRVAALLGNATGSAAFGAGATGAQVLRVVLPTDQTAIPATQSGAWTVVTSSFPTTVDTNYGTVGASTLRSAAQIGNATGAASFGAGTTGAQVLRVVLPTDQTAIPTTQSGAWSTGRTWTLASGTDSVAAVQSGTWNINNISGTISLPTGAATESTLSALNGKFANNYGVATGAVRTASQIGNAAGAADFNAGTSGAQTLRVTANITRNGTELSYNAGASDANTLRAAVNLKREGTDLDYNFGAASANSLRIAALIGNATGSADFNAGTSGAQTIRASVNITRNGTELSYNIGAPDANTLRVASMIANTTGQLDYNYGAVSAQTLRVASQIGNATGAASFGAGTTGAQVLRVVLPTDQTGINTFLDKTVQGNIVALNGTVTLATNGCSSVYVTITGSWTATLSFFAIDNVGNENAIIGITPGGALSSATSVNSSLVFPVGGYAQFRVKATAFTSGTAVVNVEANAGANALQVINLTASALQATVFLRDGAGTAIASTLINSKQRLDVNTASEGVTGSAVPFQTVQVGGSDGTNLRAIKTDTSGNVVVAGTAADGAVATGNPVQVAGKDASGNTQTIATTTTGAVQTSPTDGIKTTYSAGIVGLVTAANATDVFTISGSASKTIRITRIAMTVTTTSGSGIGFNVSLIKRSALDTTGTSTTLTNVPHDSASAAGTAVVKAYTANPGALGASVGVVRALRYAIVASNTIDLIDWDFGIRPGQCIVLRGVAENIAINFNATTVTGSNTAIDVEWTEE